MSRTTAAFLTTLLIFGLTLAIIGYVALLSFIPSPWNAVVMLCSLFIGMFFLFRQVVFANE